MKSGSAPPETFTNCRRVSPRVWRTVPSQFPAVIGGLEPAIHPLRQNFFLRSGWMRGSRITSGDAHDELWGEAIFRPFPIIAEAPYFGDGETSQQARSGQAFVEGPGAA